VRKVIYTIHGDRGAVRVEDDAIEIATQIAPEGGDARKGDGASARWDFERKDIPSDWMDSSHVTWFNSLFDDFRGAIERRDFVGKEAREAFLCVQLITTAYASAREGCRELPLGGPSSIAGHDLSDMIERRIVGP
jgi:hypothetical protein